MRILPLNAKMAMDRLILAESVVNGLLLDESAVNTLIPEFVKTRLSKYAPVFDRQNKLNQLAVNIRSAIQNLRTDKGMTKAYYIALASLRTQENEVCDLIMQWEHVIELELYFHGEACSKTVESLKQLQVRLSDLLDIWEVLDPEDFPKTLRSWTL